MIINGTDIIMIRGDTESIEINCELDDGTPRPFVDGDTVTMTIAWPNHPTHVLQKVITSFTDGAANVSLTHDDTNDILPGDYVYDVQLNGADGTVKTIIERSQFRIKEDVTRE